jgi:hypothetical protein
VTRPFSEFARFAPLRGHERASRLSNERDTYFVNIVRPHRTPWFISPDGGGRITSWGCSAGEWACQQLPGWGELSPLSPGVGTFPELFLGFGEANGPKETCWSCRGSE